MIIDVFVTSLPGRDALTRASLTSLLENTDRESMRLTVYLDGAGHDDETLRLVRDNADIVISCAKREGLPMAINRCLANIQATNEYYSHPIAGDAAKVSDFVCMVQDDIKYSPTWLNRLRSSFLFFERGGVPGRRIKFASGIECVEHPATEVLAGGRLIIKKYIRAANMFARREYWMSMYPIPRLDPETNAVRAFPGNGVGSGADWHFIRNHPNSVEKTGAECLVIPGLLTHIGYKKSTWLKRDLPESQSDIESMGDIIHS